MQVVLSFIEMKRKQKRHQPEIVITMQMADEDVINLVCWNLKPRHLNLRTFTTVDEEVTVLNSQILRSRKAANGRKRSTGAEDS